MRVMSYQPACGDEFPEGLMRLDYTSDVDGLNDWALLLPGERPELWIVVIHGHGSHGDQLFTRKDVRDTCVPVFRGSGAGILSANLRDNAWMGPAAVHDLHDLMNHLRTAHGMRQTIFCSGSMGGTSHLIYAQLHPNDVNALFVLCPATDLGAYYRWCTAQKVPILGEIAEAISQSYGGSPDAEPELYQRHSVLANAENLTMPLILIHGGGDEIIPVEHARALAEKLSHRPDFSYIEIPGGNHDSPLVQIRKFPEILTMMKT